MKLAAVAVCLLLLLATLTVSTFAYELRDDIDTATTPAGWEGETTPAPIGSTATPDSVTTTQAANSTDDTATTSIPNSHTTVAPTPTDWEEEPTDGPTDAPDDYTTAMPTSTPTSTTEAHITSTPVTTEEGDDSGSGGGSDDDNDATTTTKKAPTTETAPTTPTEVSPTTPVDATSVPVTTTKSAQTTVPQTVTTKAASTVAATTKAANQAKVVVKVDFKFTVSSPLSTEARQSVEKGIRSTLAQRFKKSPEDISVALEQTTSRSVAYKVHVEITTYGKPDVNAADSPANANYVTSVFKEELSSNSSALFNAISTATGEPVTMSADSLAVSMEVVEPTDQAKEKEKKKKSNTAAIAAGVAVAGVVVIGAIAALIYFKGRSSRVAPGERVPLNA